MFDTEAGVFLAKRPITTVSTRSFTIELWVLKFVGLVNNNSALPYV